jgi:hypothetical protein
MTDPYAIQPSELDQLPDRDPEETAEWQASLDAVTKAAGPAPCRVPDAPHAGARRGQRPRAAQAA